jgi:hypothetical protein
MTVHQWYIVHITVLKLRSFDNIRSQACAMGIIHSILDYMCLSSPCFFASGAFSDEPFLVRGISQGACFCGYWNTVQLFYLLSLNLDFTQANMYIICAESVLPADKEIAQCPWVNLVICKCSGISPAPNHTLRHLTIFQYTPSDSRGMARLLLSLSCSMALFHFCGPNGFVRQSAT